MRSLLKSCAEQFAAVIDQSVSGSKQKDVRENPFSLKQIVMMFNNINTEFNNDFPVS